MGAHGAPNVPLCADADASARGCLFVEAFAIEYRVRLCGVDWMVQGDSTAVQDLVKDADCMQHGTWGTCWRCTRCPNCQWVVLNIIKVDWGSFRLYYFAFRNAHETLDANNGKNSAENKHVHAIVAP